MRAYVLLARWRQRIGLDLEWAFETSKPIPTSNNFHISPKLNLPSENQTFKYMRPWGSFSFRPPQGLYLASMYPQPPDLALVLLPGFRWSLGCALLLGCGDPSALSTGGLWLPVRVLPYCLDSANPSFFFFYWTLHTLLGFCLFLPRFLPHSSSENQESGS